jgi:Fic family protein
MASNGDLLMSFDPDKPFNDLPLLPPKAELETKAVLRKAIAANKALAELKGVGDLIPNQGVLINTIVLQEAKMSSEIENIVTTNDELLEHFISSPCLLLKEPFLLQLLY